MYEDALVVFKQIAEDVAAVRAEVEAMKKLFCDSAVTQTQSGRPVTMLQVKAR